jgi:DNA-binding transcriptional regulator YdaS (Cro superfamily)
MAALSGVDFAFYRAIRRYGFGSFVWEVLETSSNEESLFLAEEKFIRERNTVVPHGYNIHGGGRRGASGYKHTEAAREKIASSKRGKKRPREIGEQMSRARKGKPLPAARRAALVAANKSRAWTDEARAKLSASLRNRWVHHPPRNRSGEPTKQCKLTTDDVIQIRALVATVTERKLAVRFSVSPSTINSIIHGRSWRGVGLVNRPPPRRRCDKFLPSCVAKRRKLSEAQEAEIAAIGRSMLQKDIAKKFGVSDTLVGEILIKHGIRTKRLSASDVVAIRSMANQFSRRQLADRFDVSLSNICLIIARKTWKGL